MLFLFIALIMSLFLGACPVRASEDIAPQVAAARSLMLHGDYAEASDAYSALRDDPEASVTAALGLSRCHEATGDWDKASAVVATALERHPGDADLLAQLAELSFERGQIDRARDFADRAVAAKPDHLTARWVQTAIADAIGDGAAALSGYEWFVHYYNAHNVQEPESLVLIGRAASEYAQRALLGKEQSAQLAFVLNDLYDAAGKADPDLWLAPYQSGVLFLSKFQKGDAHKDLERALAINPNAAPLHVALGVAALEDYDIETGLARCDRALAINPALPEARRLRADLLMVLERFPEAMTELERALEVNPVSEETLARVAACHLFL